MASSLKSLQAMIGRRPWLAPVLLLLLCGFLYFFRLGQLPLKDFDESYYAGGAQEMLARHEFLTPYLNGKPLLVKPILIYWLITASFRLFGICEFAARFWSAVSATGVVLLVYSFGKRLVNKRAGFLAALMLASSYQWVDEGRDASIDMVLTLLLTAALMIFFLALQRPARPRGPFVLCAYPLLGLACLAKGPLPIAVCVAGLLAYLLAVGKMDGVVRRVRLIPGLVLFLLTTLPWYVAEAMRQPAFLLTFLISEHLGHLVGHLARTSPPWGHLQNTLVFFFPWSLFLPAALIDMRGSWRRPGAVSFSAYLSIVIIGLFSFGHAKLAHYIAPAFPFLALLVGEWADGWLRRKEKAPLSIRLSFGAVLLVGASIFAGLIMLLKGHWPGVTHFWAVNWGVGIWPQCILALLAVGCMGSALLALAHRRQGALISLVVVAVLANGLVEFVINPKVALVRDQPKKELALLAARRLSPCGRLAVYNTPSVATTMYSRRAVTDLSDSGPEAVADFLRTTPGSAVITSSDFLPQLRKQGVGTLWARRKDFVIVSYSELSLEHSKASL